MVRYLSVRKIGFPRPPHKAPAHPGLGQLHTGILWGYLGCVDNLRVQVRNMRTIAKQPFRWLKWSIDMGSQANHGNGALMGRFQFLLLELLSTNTCVNTYHM